MAPRRTVKRKSLEREEVGDLVEGRGRTDRFLQKAQARQERGQMLLLLRRAGLGGDEADRALEAVGPELAGDLDAAGPVLEEQIEEKEVDGPFVVEIRRRPERLDSVGGGDDIPALLEAGAKDAEVGRIVVERDRYAWG